MSNFFIENGMWIIMAVYVIACIIFAFIITNFLCNKSKRKDESLVENEEKNSKSNGDIWIPILLLVVLVPFKYLAAGVCVIWILVRLSIFEAEQKIKEDQKPKELLELESQKEVDSPC